jgi:hypothetical protein
VGKYIMPIYVQGIMGGPLAIADSLTTMDSFSYTATNTAGVAGNVVHFLYSLISPSADQSGFVTASVDSSFPSSSPSNFVKLDEIRFIGSSAGTFILDSFIRPKANKPQKKGTVYIDHPLSPNRVAVLLRIDGLRHKTNPLLNEFADHSNIATLNTSSTSFSLQPTQIAVGVLAIANYTEDDPIVTPNSWTVQTDDNVVGEDGNGVRLIVVTKQVTVTGNVSFSWNLGNPHSWATMCHVFSG